jgi:hypothetical protein
MPSSPEILGLSLSAFTTLHVAISIMAIAAGLVVLRGFLGSHPMNAVTLLFLITTVLTSLTGFLFPFHGITPGIVIGILSLVLLAAATLGRYAFHMAGPWRWIYVVSSVVALWFNVFVFIVQSFEKIPTLHRLAPTGTELPFKAVQFAILVAFVALGYLSVRRFHVIPAVA